MKRLLLVLAVMAGACFSQYYDVSFPAVSGNEGVLVDSKMSCEEGGDWVNLVLPPSFDKATVESIIDAYYLATDVTNSTCESFVEFSADEESIEGPSGGLQFHLFYYQMLSGMEYRQDVIATGQIDGDGNVLPVGGEEEKAIAAKKNGYRYFITKPASIYDHYALERISDRDFTVIMVNDASDAREFVKGGKVPDFNISYLIATPDDINGSSPHDSAWLSKYCLWMHDEYMREVGKLDDGILKQEYLRAYDRIVGIERKGYYYSAANYMFVNLASMEALNRMKGGKVASREEVDECISGFRGFVPSYGTYENYAGASSRIERANEFEPSGEANISSVFFSNNYVMTESLLWCRLAKELAKDCEEGKDIDTSVLESLLRNYLYNFSNKGDDVDRARRLFIKGDYFGSYYELSYFLSSGEENATLKDSYGTKWGRVFAAHAYYINNSGGNNAKNSIALANYMDAMKQVVLKEGPENAAADRPGDGASECRCGLESQYGLIILLVIVIMALLFLLYRVRGAGKRRKAYGGHRRKDH